MTFNTSVGNIKGAWGGGDIKLKILNANESMMDTRWFISAYQPATLIR